MTQHHKRAIELWSQTRLSLPAIARQCGMGPAKVRALAKQSGLARPSAPQKEVPRPPAPSEGRQPGRSWRKGKFEFGSGRDSTKAYWEQRKAQREQERLAIIKLWTEGIDVEAIAARLQLRPTSVRYRLRKHGFDLKAPRHIFESSAPHHYAGSARQRGVAADWRRRT